MRTRMTAALLLASAVTLVVSATRAGTWDGTVKLGGIIVDEEGDLSSVQETYNVHDGFSLSQIRLNGMIDPYHYVTLNLHEINLDARAGDFVYRRPGVFKLTAGYDQHRQVFEAERGLNAERKDWRLGAQYTALEWLTLSGYFSYLSREGDRRSHPKGTAGALGTEYDNSLKTGQLSAEVRKGGRGGALTYRMSGYSDRLSEATDRTGRVISARFHSPCVFYDRWTHVVRGAYGVRELSRGSLEYKLSSFQYTGVVEPIDFFQFKYGFDARRIDNESTDLQTDRFQNNFDASYFHKFGRLTGGYGYETNDDDDHLTQYHSWRAGAAFRFAPYVSAKFDYAGRVKKDEEELTLLGDVEASRMRAKLEVQPVDGLTVGGGYAKRERELPDIGVEADGEMVNAFGRYRYAGWGALSADYSYSTDEYEDLAGGFETESHVVTGRLEFERIKDVRLAAGATYMDVGKDLDIEKSMVFVEGAYTVRNDYHVEIKYNVYNYDDYILIDRYYTANVVWINVAYDIHLGP